MSVISKRGIFSALAFLLIVGTAVAIWGVPRFIHKNTSTKGQVAMFLLDDRGVVNGLLLSTGDQIHFSPETGEIVGSQIKIGDEVTATGHAGTQTNYGREFHCEQLALNGQTFVEVHAGPGPKPRHDDGPGEREQRTRIEQPVLNPTSSEPQKNPSTSTTESEQTQAVNATTAPTPEVVKVSGTVKTHLVNGHGDVHGLILGSGEQIRVGPKVGQMVVAAEQGGSNTLNIEGTVIRTERGVVIRPKYISVGNQTITLGR